MKKQIPKNKKTSNPDVIREKRLANLKPFKPGNNMNPKGKPVGTKNFSTLFKEAIIKIASSEGTTPEDIESKIIQAGINKAKSGDYKFYQDTLDRMHGKPIQRQDITSGGHPLFKPSEEEQKKIDDAIDNLI